MSTHHPKHLGVRLTALLLALFLGLTGCSAGNGTDVRSAQAPETDASDSSRYLRIVNDEPDTADPQCTDGYYDIPLNVFDRLVEIQQKEDGSSSFVPSLAKSWEISKEAGYPDGFDLELVVDDEGTYYSRQILELAAFMWGKIGVRASIRTVGTEEYLSLRKSGALACNVSRFSVDYNDPDAIIYVFFGSRENALHRGLGYENEEIIGRVNEACSILNEEERLSEHRALERTIVQEECAWIPLFSNEHYFIVSERVKNFRVSWNGWTDTPYRNVVIED